MKYIFISVRELHSVVADAVIKLCNYENENAKINLYFDNDGVVYFSPIYCGNTDNSIKNYLFTINAWYFDDDRLPFSQHQECELTDSYVSNFFDDINDSLKKDALYRNVIFYKLVNGRVKQF